MTVHTATESNDATSQNAAPADTAASRPTEDNHAPVEESAQPEARAAARRRPNRRRILAYGILPGLALTLAIANGTLKYLDSSASHDLRAEAESVQAAKNGTVAMLSYRPDTVERQLHDASALLSGTFHDSYTALINDVVIPGSKQKQISATATVPAAASVSAESRHAVVLVFVDQTVVVGSDAPADTTSAIRVTLDKTSGHWLVSQFDPI
ncbi:MAG: Mce-associated rane protein [Mycobacterium sp.]|nr:Mce-associated rane protein [Mycobacterium sp.]